VVSYIPNRWALLRIDVRAPGLLFRDNQGTDEVVGWEEVGTLLGKLAADLPLGRDGPHNTGPVPLPVFIKTVEPLSTLLAGKEVRENVSREIDFDQIQLVWLAREAWKRRSPFQLPLKVLASGPLAAESVAALQDRWWLKEDKVTADFGLNIQVEPWEIGLRGKPDILIVEHSLAPLDAIERLSLNDRPRLIVLLQPPYLDEIPTSEVAEGTSWLVLGPQKREEFGKFMTEFLFELIHDLPLHEAVKAALRRSQIGGDSVALVSDPEANHDLRLLDALTSIWSEGAALEAEFGWMKEQLLAGKSISRGAKVIEERLFLEKTVQESISAAVEWAGEARADFQQETVGLRPLAQTGAALEFARGATQELRDSLTTIARDNVVVETLREEQDRRVDIGVERVNAYGLRKDVGKGSSLALNRRYRLRVHIGNLMEGSIMTGDVPPINLLLPDDERGHDLEIAVQPKDFTLLSAAAQKLHLPPVGGTAPVYFLLRTPSCDGTATLRVLVYHENHLLQSFLVEARITAEEEYSATESLISGLEFSQSEKFTNLETLKPRAISIGANQQDNTHQLTLKGNGAKDDVNLPPVRFDEHMKEFREILAEATYAAPGSDQPRQFPSLTPAQPPSTDFAKYLKKLARLGNDFYNELFGRTSGDLQRALAELKLRPLPNQPDEVIQVVRFDETFAFPWALLYDFDLPANDNRPVCPGGVPDPAGGSVPCTHGPEDDVFCAKGFWGIRHVIEELLLIKGKRADAQFTVERQDTKGAVRIAATRGLVAGNDLTAHLKQKLGAGEVEEGPPDDAALINLLWKDPPERPSVLIILGHLATDAPLYKDEPNDPRIVLVDGSKWLTERRLAQRYQKVIDPWKHPRSLILLMACESSALSADKINTFVKTFSLAGALGVAGTECIVFSELAARFAEEITIALWSESKRLGEAVTAFRRRLMFAGNPLGFVFHCVGSADLALSKP
jgi:hypothetical protein